MRKVKSKSPLAPLFQRGELSYLPHFKEGGIKGKNFNVLPPPLVKGE